MTTKDQSRRPGRRPLGGKGSGANGTGGPSALGERLRLVREAKGVDINRVERDTKIRSKYLVALESGDYAELPGDVYTKGFLRNYAVYLGLDADEIAEQWRRERGGSPTRQDIVGPRPLSVPRRRLLIQPSHFALLLLAAVVVAAGLYFGYQVYKYTQNPVLAISDPAQTPITLSEGTATYVLRGTATAGATIQVSWNGEDAKTTAADGSGHWSFSASLQPGSNRFDVTAVDAGTDRSSAMVSRVIMVKISSATLAPPPQLTVSSPADAATFGEGTVTVVGSTVDAVNVTVTPTYVGPPPAAGASASPGRSAGPTPKPTPTPTPKSTPTPTPTPLPGASASASAATGPCSGSTPAPVTSKVVIDGTFSIDVQLCPGVWQLAIVADNGQGLNSAVVTRTVTVAFKGMTVVIEIKGGDAWLKVWRDGVVDSALNGGAPHKAGSVVTVTANQSVWIRTGHASATYITVNGVSYGQLSRTVVVGSWRLSAGSPPQPSNDV